MSGAAAGACDDGAIFPPRADQDASTEADVAIEADTDDAGDATVDASADARDATRDEDVKVSDGGDGLCRTVTADAAPDLPCEAGSACSYPDDASGPRCTSGIDAAGIGSNIECGGITCGEYCYCAGPAASVCGCVHASIGPLSPPDLPSAAVQRTANVVAAADPPRAQLGA